MIYKLSKHPGAQCQITMHEDMTIEFISYTTSVIKATPIGKCDLSKFDAIHQPSCTTAVERDGIMAKDTEYVLTCTGTYSQTTSRQISWFLREWFAGISLGDMQEIAGQNECVLAYRGSLY